MVSSVFPTPIGVTARRIVAPHKRICLTLWQNIFMVTGIVATEEVERSWL
jgi:hypothetical protein